MIYHVTGGLGSGKTMFAVQQVVDAILTGKKVITNVRLVDGWDYILTRHQLGGLSPFVRYLKSDYIRMIDFQLGLARSYLPLYSYHNNILEACNSALELGSAPEKTRLFVFDEAQIFINAREWQKSSKVIIEFFTQSRKLGFDVYIISQDKDSIDRQVRCLADMQYVLKNLSNIRPFGIKIFPNVGLLVKRHSATALFSGAQSVSYASWLGSIYNTSQLLSVNLPPPSSWSAKYSSPWVSGCKARYEHGVCRFREVAKDSEFKFIHERVAPYMNDKKDVGFTGDMEILTNLPEVI